MKISNVRFVLKYQPNSKDSRKATLSGYKILCLEKEFEREDGSKFTTRHEATDKDKAEFPLLWKRFKEDQEEADINNGLFGL